MASEPDKWDYALAGVPSPLTDEMESQQMAKQVSLFTFGIPHVSSTSMHLGLPQHVVNRTSCTHAPQQEHSSARESNIFAQNKTCASFS